MNAVRKKSGLSRSSRRVSAVLAGGLVMVLVAACGSDSTAEPSSSAAAGSTAAGSTAAGSSAAGSSESSGAAGGSETASPSTASSGAASSEAPLTGTGPEVTFNLGHVFPDGSIIDEAADQFAADVLERTGGTVTINIFPGGQLGGDEEMATALSGGTQEMAVLNVGATGLGQRVQLQSLPYLVSSYEAADEMFFGDGYVAEFDRETLSQNGMVGLDFVENGFRALSNNTKPVTLPADLAGLKLRTPTSELIVNIFNTWGAQPTAIPFPELYTALEQGTVDGQENGLTLFYDSKFFEVQQYYTDTRYIYATAVFTVSQASWDQLSPEQQAVLQQASEQASQAQREAVRAKNDATLADLKTKIEVIELTQDQYQVWRDSVKPTYDSAGALFGQDVIDGLLEAAEAANG